MGEPMNKRSLGSLLQELRDTMRKIGQIDIKGGDGDGEKTRLGRRADELEAEIQKRGAW